MIRNHTPIQIEEFNGLWKRGDAEATPPDHFSDCNNIQFINSGFRTRDGIAPHLPIENVRRIYTFIQETGSSLLYLDSGGNIYDTGSPTPAMPILSIAFMYDFAFVSINGRAYLSPHDGIIGLPNEYVYVYEGNGTHARLAANRCPKYIDGAMAGAQTNGGFIEVGVHIFGVIYETSSGFLTSISEQLLEITVTNPNLSVYFTSIPVSPDPSVVKVHLVATKAINPETYTHNQRGYAFYRTGTIVNNGVNYMPDVSFYDSELLDDVTHLQDLFEAIPACANLTKYHGRMVCVNSADDISLLRISAVGEPEAINKIDGLVIIPLDGNPLTNAREFRDLLYAFKQVRTYAIVDNGDVPSAWTVTVIDEGIGCSVHGLGTVLDSGGVNIDFLIIANYNGVTMFNGTYIKPELSWKIKDLWFSIPRAFYINIQVINDSLRQILYINIPNKQILVGDYSVSLDSKNIKWAVWTIPVNIVTLVLTDVNLLLMGSCYPLNSPQELMPVENLSIYSAKDLGLTPLQYLDNPYSDGLLRTLWYKFKAPPEIVGFSVDVAGNASFSVQVSIYKNQNNHPTQVNVTAYPFPSSDSNIVGVSLAFVNEPGTTYYLEVVPISTGNAAVNLPTSDTTITIQHTPNDNAWSYSAFLMQDNDLGYPAVLDVPEVTNITQFRAELPNGGAAAVIDYGHICLENISFGGATIYSILLEKVVDIHHLAQIICSNRIDTFVISGKRNPDIQLIDRFGNILKTWFSPPRINMGGMGINADNTLLYAINFDDDNNKKIISKLSETALISEFGSAAPNCELLDDILVLYDGTIIVGEYSTVGDTTTPKLVRYDANGVFLGNSTQANWPLNLKIGDRLYHGWDNPNSFWVLNDSGNGYWFISQYTTTTMNIRAQYTQSIYIKGVYSGDRISRRFFGLSKGGQPVIIKQIIPPVTFPPYVDEEIQVGLNCIYKVEPFRKVDTVYLSTAAQSVEITKDIEINNPFVELYTVSDNG